MFRYSVMAQLEEFSILAGRAELVMHNNRTLGWGGGRGTAYVGQEDGIYGTVGMHNVGSHA